MSNAEPLPQNAQTFRAQTFRAQAFGAQAYRHSRQRRPQTARAPFPPLVEQALLFTFLAGGAGFWIGVIWWILR